MVQTGLFEICWPFKMVGSFVFFFNFIKAVDGHHVICVVVVTIELICQAGPLSPPYSCLTHSTPPPPLIMHSINFNAFCSRPVSGGPAAVGLLDARLTRSALLTGSIGNILHLDLLIVFGQSELQQSPAGQSVIEIEERLLYKECTETVWIKGYHTIFL